MPANMTRREFAKTTGLAAAAAAVCISAGPSQAQEKTGPSHKPLTKVNCFSEDGELKEVIFGTMEGFRRPQDR